MPEEEVSLVFRARDAVTAVARKVRAAVTGTRQETAALTKDTAGLSAAQTRAANDPAYRRSVQYTRDRLVEMKKATDSAKTGTRQLGDETERARKKSAGIGAFFKQQWGMIASSILGAVGAMVLFRKAVELAKSSIAAWAEEERAIGDLRVSLVRAGEDGAAALETLRQGATDIQTVFGHADEAVLRATARVSQFAPSLKVDQLRDAQLVLVGLAGITGDLDSSGKLLSKTLAANINVLSRYGIQVKATATAEEKLAQLRRDPKILTALAQQEAFMQTQIGQAKAANLAWGDYKETIGDILVNIALYNSESGTLAEKIIEANEETKRHRDQIVLWGRAALMARDASLKLQVALVGAFVQGVGVAIRTIQGFVMLAVASIARVINEAIGGINAVLRLADKIPGVGAGQIREVRQPGLGPAFTAFGKAVEAGRAVGRNVRAGGAAVGAAFTGLTSLSKPPAFIPRGTEPEEPVTLTGGGKPGVTAPAWRPFTERFQPFVPTPPPTTGFRGVTPIGLQRGRRSPLAGAPGTGFGAGAFERGEEAFGPERPGIFETMLDDMAELVPGAESASSAVADAFTGAFANLGSAWEDTVASIFAGEKSLGEAMAGAVMGGVKKAASALGDYHFAQGIGKLAEGTWPPNPIAWKAAGGHFLAAAAFKTLAGAMGGMGRRGAGGGGAGSGAEGALGRGREQTGRGAGTLTVIFPSALLDMSDPRTERAMIDALETAHGRRVTFVFEGKGRAA